MKLTERLLKQLIVETLKEQEVAAGLSSALTSAEQVDEEALTAYEAKAVAAAIVDNSIDELQHIPAETRHQLKTQVAKINELINQA